MSPRIATLRDSWSEPRPVPLPSATTPRILADANGGIYAFWLQGSTEEGQAAAQGPEEAVAWPLMYSQLATDGTSWLPPVILAESSANFDVTTDAAGALYLDYLPTTLYRRLLLLGLLYRDHLMDTLYLYLVYQNNLLLLYHTLFCQIYRVILLVYFRRYCLLLLCHSNLHWHLLIYESYLLNYRS